ncbi:DUF5305 domain-containing protein [Halobellus sp. EA9]|uniref:DUF5305 domain-containing protein n=1 Tax=Halobellus sp. EA9 TaxID=3421647 RepID=UPI003EBDE025
MAFEHRAKLFVSENVRLIAGVLLVLGLLCFAGAGYVFVTPTTQTLTEQTDQQTFSTRVDESALVTQATPLYDEGERIENRSVYFTGISPELTFTMNTSVPADQQVEVHQQLSLELLGVRGDQPFYRSERSIVDTTRQVQDGLVSTTATVNVSDVSQELAVLVEEVGNAGQFLLRLQMNVTYRTDAYQGSLQSTVPFVISGNSYYVDGTLSAERTESTTVTREITRPPSPVEYGALAVLGLLMVGAAAAVTRVEDRVDPEELRTRIAHDQHQEWISRGQFPTDSEKQYISILTLEDLVDVAIDTNRRVIHDPQIDAYAVIDSSEIYYYALEDVEAGEWLEI